MDGCSWAHVFFIWLLLRANTTDLQASVGHLTWFATLNRLSFSCFDAIDDVTSSLGDIRTIVDPRALIEIALFASLFPWLEADLIRK